MDNFGSNNGVFPQNDMGVGQPKNDVKAIISMIIGIISIPLLCICLSGILTGIASIILGIFSRNSIKNSNGTKTGEGMALAGIILGAVAIVLGLVVIIYFLVSGNMSDVMQGIRDGFREGYDGKYK